MLLCGRLQESLTRCFVLCQILMLEYTHANGGDAANLLI